MTGNVQKALDEHLMAALCVVLSSGHTIENTSGAIRLFEDEGRYVVRMDGPVDAVAVDEFDDVRSAVAFYLDLCDPA